MNIFGNLIKDQSIIGISDYDGQQLPNDGVQLHFTVFTTSNKINVHSPAFGPKDDLKKDGWVLKYLQVRKLVAQQIGELTASE